MLILALSMLIAGPTTPREQFEALTAEYTASEAVWEKRNPGGGNGTGEENAARYRDWPAWSFAPRMIALAELHLDDPAAADALFWVADQISAVGDRDRNLTPYSNKAFDLLAATRIDDSRIDALCRRISRSGGSWASERFLRTVAEKATDRAVRGRANLALARYLANRRQIAIKPWFDKETKDPFMRQMIDRIDPSLIQMIHAVDPEALLVEVERQYGKTANDFGDVPFDARDVKKRPISLAVESELHEIWHLAVGKTAPSIEGKDVDDTPFTLEDYRGKVVLLSFSGDWCLPCKAMYPQERAIVERLKGKPFVLLSVNTDAKKETLRDSIKAGEVTWRCWWDGPDRPICDLYNVAIFPTVLLIDAKGIIREKGLKADKIDEAVDALLKETANP